MMTVVGLMVSLSRTTVAQTAQFSSEADAISGTVTHSVLGPLPTIVNIAPVDQSNTDTTGSHDVSGASVSQTLFGVEVYNFENVDDFTKDDETASADDGFGEAKTGKGSLLGGLITWTGNDNSLTCSPDPINPTTQVDCTSTAVARDLTINGVAIPHGNYSSGSTFPVNGQIVGDGSSCPSGVGVESFTGYLVIQESTITQNLTTGTISLTVNGMHLLGNSTCVINGAQLLSTNFWDIRVAGPAVGSTGALGMLQAMAPLIEPMMSR